MRHMDVMTTYNIGHKIPKYENALKTLFHKTISPKNFSSLRGGNDINNRLEILIWRLSLINIQVDVILL